MTVTKIHHPRVLFVTYTVPWNPRYGGALRCFGIVRELANRSDLHVALAGDDPGAVEAFLTWPAPSNLTRHALSPDTGWEHVSDQNASRSVRALLGWGKYHTALQQLEKTFQPTSVWYFEVESLRRASLPRCTPVVLDHCDVRWRKQVRFAQLSVGVRRGLALLKAVLLRVDDVQLALRVQHSLVASPDEVNLLWPTRDVTVVFNGFDYPTTAPVVSSDEQRLLFFGSLFYTPNADGVRWMCQKIWPLIKARKPAAQLDIVGLGKEALADLADTPGVTFHGFVDDLDAMMREAAALVVPLRIAGGTRIKIIEAWAKGLPVISTTIGAEGLAARDGETALLADTAEAFADCCARALDDRELREKLTAAGYEHGRSRFDWPVVGTGLDPVLAEFSGQKAQTP
jgi:glycosyltransferase involved in cell wall biosynthesis